MDRRERLLSQRFAEWNTLEAAMRGWQANIWTAMPGKVHSIDNLVIAGTIEVEVTIQSRILAADGSQQWMTLPILPDVPVVFQGGGGFTATFPIQIDDECVVIFASRSIDHWWDRGGVQQQAESRMHDLSDAFALVGVRSRPNWITGYNKNNAQLRSDDGKNYLEMTPNGDINMVATEDITMTATRDVRIAAGRDIIVTSGRDTDITATGFINETATQGINLVAGTDIIEQSPTTIQLNTPVVQISGVVSVLNQNNVATGGTIKGSINIQQGSLTAQDAVIAGFETGDQVSLQTHSHIQLPDSRGDTEAPTNPPTAGT